MINKEKNKGKLYGVGIGPGDPELITLKAARILNNVDYIAVPKTAAEKESLAYTIAAGVITARTKLLELLFPMSFNEQKLEESWATAVVEIKKKLDEGLNVAFITLGDPTVYSTYMYIHKKLSEMGYTTEIVPGITSFCASAARAGVSLAENKEAFAVIPSAYDCADLDQIIERFDNIVLMKVAKRFEEIRNKLKSLGLGKNTIMVSKCTQPEEEIYLGIDDIDVTELSYFTTIIIKKNGF